MRYGIGDWVQSDVMRGEVIAYQTPGVYTIVTGALTWEASEGDLQPAIAPSKGDAEAKLARVREVVHLYESCGPKQQSTRDVLKAVREALDGDS